MQHTQTFVSATADLWLEKPDILSRSNYTQYKCVGANHATKYAIMHYKICQHILQNPPVHITKPASTRVHGPLTSLLRMNQGPDRPGHAQQLLDMRGKVLIGTTVGYAR